VPSRLRNRRFVEAIEQYFDGFVQLGDREELAVPQRRQYPTFHDADVMEMQQSGRLQNDGGAENAGRAHEKGTQTGDDTIRGAQIGRTLAAATEDPQLMFDEHRLGNDGTEASRPC